MLSLKGAQEILPLSVANLGRFPIRNGLKHARRCPRIDAQGKSHSHSIVPGGFEVISYTTRLIPRTSLIIRVAARPRKL